MAFIRRIQACFGPTNFRNIPPIRRGDLTRPALARRSWKPSVCYSAYTAGLVHNAAKAYATKLFQDREGSLTKLMRRLSPQDTLYRVLDFLSQRSKKQTFKYKELLAFFQANRSCIVDDFILHDLVNSSAEGLHPTIPIGSVIKKIPHSIALAYSLASLVHRYEIEPPYNEQESSFDWNRQSITSAVHGFSRELERLQNNTVAGQSSEDAHALKYTRHIETSKRLFEAILDFFPR